MSQQLKIRSRKNRHYGDMKLAEKITVQLSCDTLAYLREEAKRLKISYGEALDRLVRYFAGSEESS